MTVHEMRLHPIPFESIKIGTKTVEIRLNDEKRRAIKVGDRIDFALRPDLTEKYVAEVAGLDTFQTFKEAYANYQPQDYGGKDQSEWEGMYQYYSAEDETEFGVLGIRLKSLA